MPKKTGQSMQQPDKINLAFLIPSLQTGGAEMQLLSLVKGLDAQRFRITVIVLYAGYELESQVPVRPGIRLVRLYKRNAFDLFAFFRLIFVLKRGRFSILQSYNVSARLWGLMAARYAGIPRVISMERTARVIYSTPGSRFYVFAEKFVMRKSDLIIANSRAGKRFAMSRGAAPGKVRVIYNGLDPDRLFITRSRHELCEQWRIPAQAFILTWVGRLETVKDPMTFIDAVHRAVQSSAPVYAFIVGNGSLRSACEQTAAELGIRDRIVFTGTRSDVSNYYHAADAVVLSSGQVEGCSNTILEAMYLAKPVVATRVGGNPELIEHGKTGYLSAPGDAGALASEIQSLTENPERLTVGESARHSVQIKFSQTAMINAFETVYDELMKTGG
ncbi:MAG: glycosyltransferase [candidate division KSB1 bacterium]|nr:glycosyltransferase [candidate division KSB1 bacterium]